MPTCLSRRALLAATLSAPFAASAQNPSPRARSGLSIGGTGAGLGPLQRLAEALGLHSLAFVPNLGTGGGLKALAAGAIDIAVAARRLQDDERTKGLVEREVFRTPVVWAAHEGVAPRSVTLDELVNLYAARTAQWPNGTPVRLVLRPDSDTDTRYLKSLSPAMAEAVALAQARPGVRMATTDTDATEALERIPGALGLTTLGLVLAERRRLQVLELGGVAPRLDTLAAGRYPYAKTLYLVTRGVAGGATTEAVQALTARAATPLLATLGCQAPTA